MQTRTQIRTRTQNLLHLLLLFSLTCLPGKIGGVAWGQAVPVAPDCQLFFSFSTAATSANFDNRYQGCVTWTVQYTSSGFTGLTLAFQSAAGAVTPGRLNTLISSATTTDVVTAPAAMMVATAGRAPET